ncbi:hypothetical protein Q31b_05190 [Novipirellula aureliae]|uniref:DUF1499 domain-containing protein n=1 Tax=Novipirellula aureliae TaxID=2527966 RepID=A0A5C6EBM5_9BACT|nr:DUF1499 domain-containing protein [Novipirellula aureliae]TWU45347.1 hypothetical protein Q31b_05190 [Novipirellula aureliae]
MIGFIVLAVVAISIVAVCSRIDNWSRDFTTNDAKLALDSLDPGLRIAPLSESAEVVAQRIETWAGEQSKWKVLERKSSDRGIHLHLTRTTMLFRFVDDIHVDLVRAGDGCRMEAESQSRVGKGDLGQNPRNLKELVSAVRS